MLSSTPIDACSLNESFSLNESGSAHASGNSRNISGDFPSGWSLKAQKKNKPGIFAKLLDGLTAKVGPPASGRAGFVDALGREKPEISGTIAEKAGKNALKSASGVKKQTEFGFSGEFGVIGDFSTLIVPEFDSAGQSQKAENGLDFLGTTRNQGRSGVSGKNSALFNENNPGLFVKNDEFAPGHGPGMGHEEVIETALKNAANKAGRGGSQKPGGAKNEGESFFVSLRDFEAEYRNLSRQAFLSIAGDTGKENSRLTEFRGRKSRERPGSAGFQLEVRDLRTGEAGLERGLAEAARGTGLLRAQGAEMEIPVDLKLNDGGGQGAAGKETIVSQSFEDALAAELRGNLSTDIVRDATVIVRNGGEGTIRLSLRPATLGDVKIRLELTENKITGHIIVESNDAFRAFERELPVLEKAFRDSGFSETNLDMSFAQDRGSFGAGEQGQNADFGAYYPSFAASRYEADAGLPEGFAPQGLATPDGKSGLSPGRTPVNLLV